ncbi:MAG: hypothetical protein HQL19_00645 [Candidatus Omnitrophica bacterium]|nr:hypothetical protein [Candidatus Omnitrophota bacterium]
MSSEKKKNEAWEYGSCVNLSSKSLWIIGTIILGLATFFCVAVFSSAKKPIPMPDQVHGVMVQGAQQVAFQPGQETVVLGGALQAAYVPPGCATCPTVTNCFPGAAGSAQQVALTNPNCATCPSVAQCFPQGINGAQQVAFRPGCAVGVQQVAFQRPVYSGIRCPRCNHSYIDQNAGANGFSRCPRCGANITMNSQAQGAGIQNVAFTQPMAGQANGAPMIFRDAVMPHEYRGVCERCHVVNPDIAIPITAQMPHNYRGVCSNCHLIQGLTTGAK